MQSGPASAPKLSIDSASSSYRRRILPLLAIQSHGLYVRSKQATKRTGAPLLCSSSSSPSPSTSVTSATWGTALMIPSIPPDASFQPRKSIRTTASASRAARYGLWVLSIVYFMYLLSFFLELHTLLGFGFDLQLLMGLLGMLVGIDGGIAAVLDWFTV